MKLIATAVAIIIWSMFIYTAGRFAGKRVAKKQIESVTARLRESKEQLEIAVASNQQKEKK